MVTGRWSLVGGHITETPDFVLRTRDNYVLGAHILLRTLYLKILDPPLIVSDCVYTDKRRRGGGGGGG